MKKEVEELLSFCQQNIMQGSNLNKEIVVTYIANLPHMYSSDIEFRLLFDWHFSVNGTPLRAHEIHEMFKFQLFIVESLGKLYNLNYQFFNFFVFHVLCNLKGKDLLEIGGSLPSQMIFDLFGVQSYINTESPDYIDADGGRTYTEKHEHHQSRRTIYQNAEDIGLEILPNSIDCIFSVACFEHIYDLESALISCHNVQKNGGFLYSFFAPIYSYLKDGHHGVIPNHSVFTETPWGMHLLSHADQRRLLQSSGMTNPQEIQEFLGAVNFNRIPNRLYYEDYYRILTESPYYVQLLDPVCPGHNISKMYPDAVKRIRASNPIVKNLGSQGFRVLLQKNK